MSYHDGPRSCSSIRTSEGTLLGAPSQILCIHWPSHKLHGLVGYREPHGNSMFLFIHSFIRKVAIRHTAPAYRIGMWTIEERSRKSTTILMDQIKTTKTNSPLLVWPPSRCPTSPSEWRNMPVQNRNISFPNRSRTIPIRNIPFPKSFIALSNRCRSFPNRNRTY